MRVRRSSLFFLILLILFCLPVCDPSPYYGLRLEVKGPGEVSYYPVLRTYPRGTQVTLMAKPHHRSTFLQWGGDVLGYQQELTLVMDSHLVVMAFFQGYEYATISGEVIPVHTFSFQKEQTREKLLTWVQEEEQPPSPPIVEVLVGLKPELRGEAGSSFLTQMGYEVLEILSPLSTFLLRLPPLKSQDEVMKELAALPEVLYVEENGSFSLLGDIIPNDPFYEKQWHLPLIRLPSAWRVTRGDPLVEVAIIDTGVDSSHPDLIHSLNLKKAYNFVKNNRDVQDENGHGTHVAGILAATTHNEVGVAGVMWEASLIPLKVFSNGSARFSDVARAILYAAGLDALEKIPPVDIINLSLGTPGISQSLDEAIELASQAGVMMVAAAGNYRDFQSSSIMYPASHPLTIAVGSVDYQPGQVPIRSSFSCYGEGLNLMAPGGSFHTIRGVFSTVPSAVNSSGYAYMAGTSMASPQVAGVIGLMLAAGIPPSQIQETLERTALSIGPKEEYGQGLIQASFAVNHVPGIRVMVGERQGDMVEILAETLVPLKGGEYSLDFLPKGEFYLMAWLDLEGTGEINRGDYFGELGPISIEVGEEISLDLYLEEMRDETRRKD